MKENQFHPVSCSALHAEGTKNEKLAIRSERKKTQDSRLYVDTLNYAALFIRNITCDGVSLATVIQFVSKWGGGVKPMSDHLQLRSNFNTQSVSPSNILEPLPTIRDIQHKLICK